MYCRESDQDLITLNKATSPLLLFSSLTPSNSLAAGLNCHPSQITSPPPSPPGTTSISFSNPPVVHDLILCDTFSTIRYSGNSIEGVRTGIASFFLNKVSFMKHPNAYTLLGQVRTLLERADGFLSKKCKWTQLDTS